MMEKRTSIAKFRPLICPRRADPSFVAILLAVVLPTRADEPAAKTYDGLTLQQWTLQLPDIDPSSPTARRTVRGLTAIVADESLPGEVRRPFALRLGRIGKPASSAAKVLAAIVGSRHEAAEPDSLWAARALGFMGSAAKDAAPVLVDMLFDRRSSSLERQLAVGGLAGIGGTHPDVIPALIRLFQETSAGEPTPETSRLRWSAIAAFEAAGPDADLVAPLLIRVVRAPRESELMRRTAITALGEMKFRAVIAMPVLCEALEFDKSPAAQDAAANALAKIGEQAVPVLARYLHHEDAKIRSRIVTSLGQILGADAKLQAARFLRTAGDDESADVRLAVAESLWQLTRRPDPAVPIAIALVADRDRSVRFRAMDLLIQIRSRDERHLQALALLGEHSNPQVRRTAARTLEKILAP